MRRAEGRSAWLPVGPPCAHVWRTLNGGRNAGVLSWSLYLYALYRTGRRGAFRDGCRPWSSA